MLLESCSDSTPAEALLCRALSSWLAAPSTKNELYVWSCFLALPAPRVTELRTMLRETVAGA
ncbi:MAG: hypothetical protein CMM50_00720 [Rhodospirillaceae bacterium]|nr:hypothetical protein [Rhodospirillaceae bacterium]